MRDGDSDHISENEAHLDFPCTFPTQPVLIYPTNVGSQCPNFPWSKGNMGGKQGMTQERLNAFEQWVIEQMNRLFGRSLALQLFAQPWQS